MTLIFTIFTFVMMLGIIGGANYYIAKRIYQCISFFLPNTRFFIYIIFFAVMTVIMILGFANSFLPFNQTVKKILDTIGSIWMGVFVYLLIFVILADLVVLIMSLCKAVSWPITPNVRMISGLVVLLLTTVTVTYGMIHARNIKHVSYNVSVSSELQQDINLVLITDLHLGSLGSESRLDKIVEEINSLDPDIVCIAGDFFNTDFDSISNCEKAARTLRKISSKYGVYASFGNHDAGQTFEKMTDFLKECNITALSDEYVVIDNLFTLVGRLDGSPIGGYTGQKRKELSQVLAGVDESLPIIVMDHNPANISQYTDEVDLILSGHTHKGQIFPGSLITNAMYTVDYGYYRKDDNSPHVIVSSGIGTWGLPVRVGSNSEIVSVCIKIE